MCAPSIRNEEKSILCRPRTPTMRLPRRSIAETRPKETWQSRRSSAQRAAVPSHRLAAGRSLTPKILSGLAERRPAEPVSLASGHTSLVVSLPLHKADDLRSSTGSMTVHDLTGTGRRRETVPAMRQARSRRRMPGRFEEKGQIPGWHTNRSIAARCSDELSPSQR